MSIIKIIKIGTKKLATNIITNAANAINTKALNIYLSPPITNLNINPAINWKTASTESATKKRTPNTNKYKNNPTAITSITIVNPLIGFTLSL